MNNYRINFSFGLNGINYWKSFHLCRGMWPVICKIKSAIKEADPEARMWWFFEPYIEITWIQKEEHDRCLKAVEKAINEDLAEWVAKKYTPEEIKEKHIPTKYAFMHHKDYKKSDFVGKGPVEIALYYLPSDGRFVDWYCESEEERSFGAFRHAGCAALLGAFYEWMPEIQKGKGLNRQVARTIHTVCNPLGLNYIEEAKICWFRFRVCIFYIVYGKSRLFRKLARKLKIFEKYFS